MSKSHHFQVKEDEKNIKSTDDLLPLPTSKEISPDDQHVVEGTQDENNPKDDYITKKLEDHGESSTINCSENISEKESQPDIPDDDDDDDGFSTPTSTDHKIPEMTTCPPAPVKKRKASVSTTIHPTLQVDFESTFTDQEDHSGRNIKKSRNPDHQE